MVRRSLLLLTLIVFALAATPGFARTQLVLEDGSDSLNLGDYAEYLEETGPTLELADVVDSPNWKAPADASLGFTPRKHGIWFRIRLVDGSSVRDWILEFSYPLLDRIEAYQPDASGAMQRISAGRLLPFAAREIQDRTINIRLNPGKSGSYSYFRIQTESSFQAEARIYQRKTLLERYRTDTLVYGFYFGILFIMALYNFALFVSIRDPNYFLYSGYVAIFLVYQIWHLGYGFQYVVPNEPLLYKQSYYALLGLAVLSAITFSAKFLNLKEVHRLLFYVIVGATAIVVTGAMLGAFVYYPLATKFVPPLAGILFFLTLVASVICIRRGYKPARYYLLAWGAFLTLAILFVLGVRGIIPFEGFVKHGMQVGSVLEVLMLSFALGYRYSLLQKQKEDAQREIAESKSRLLESVFRFVPKEFLRCLGKDSLEGIQLGDAVQRDMTVLFSDIRSFTTISEGMTPTENFQFLNALYRRICPLIREHHGFIDKYIGDGIMALFPENPRDAVTTAIEMNQLLRIYNDQRLKQGYAPIRIGIGIHSGKLILGTIGEAQRMEGTVISDAVNLASRMESLTKHYGAVLLVTESTLQNVSANDFMRRTLDRVRVKGKQEQVSIVEILDCESPEIRDLKLTTLADFESAIKAYNAQDFETAAQSFGRVLEQNPNDLTARIYLTRLDHLRRLGVPEGWDGIETLTIK
ncbi:MAG: guanylate cyclase [Leptospirales bacterium]|nr:guanylate cyclase [Leptospirales bacterium]